MCLVKYMENHEYEWHDLDDVDTTGLNQPMENSVKDGTPIINVHDRVLVWIDVQKYYWVLMLQLFDNICYCIG